MLPALQSYELLFWALLAFGVAVVVLPVLAVALVLARWFRLGTQLGLLRRRTGMSRPLGWAVGLATTGGFIAPFVAGDPPVEGPGELSFALAAVLYGGGVFFAGYALARRDYRRLVRGTPTTDTGAALQPGELVELEGEATPAHDPVAAPVTGEPCLAYRYRVDEHRFAGRRNVWAPVDYGRGGARFEVDDGSGPTTVDPAGARLDLHDAEAFVLDADEERPAPVRELNETIQEADPDDRLRYREWRLDPGETAYVLGVAEDRASADHLGRVVVGQGDGSGPFVVADRGEELLKRRLRLVVAYGGPGGALAAVAGLWWMLSLAGVG